MGKISYPEPLTENHILDSFESGEIELDNWLKQRALKNDLNDASRTFVVHVDMHVKGFYCLSNGCVSLKEAPGKIRRNMPNPIPVMILGRLAVDKFVQSQGLGKGLLKDAVLRSIRVSKDSAFKALLVHAISDSAIHFYKRFGFVESPLSDRTLLLPLTIMKQNF